MKIVIIDGQGGRMGAALASAVKAALPESAVVAVGTNSIATSAMLKSGADCGATGENAVVVNCRGADLIMGPLGVLMADALMGEVTPAMAVAVGQSAAYKVLVPTGRCGVTVVGAGELPLARAVEKAAELAVEFSAKRRQG